MNILGEAFSILYLDYGRVDIDNGCADMSAIKMSNEFVVCLWDGFIIFLRDYLHSVIPFLSLYRYIICAYRCG